MPYSALNPRYTFGGFVVGDSNREAYTAAVGMASSQAVFQNLLYLCGGVGSGKTHLLHAIGNAVKPLRPRVLYCTSEQFTNAIIRAYRTDAVEQFEAGLVGIDVLLVDDVHFLAGKERTQQVFLEMFERLSLLSRQVVVTSNCHPAELEGMDRKFVQWFERGTATRINAADKALTVRILQRRAWDCGIELRDDVTSLLASGCGTARELEGALNRLVAECSLMNAKPNLTTVRRFMKARRRRPISGKCCLHLGLADWHQ
jgi:chromosomal replication initiator protein